MKFRFLSHERGDTIVEVLIAIAVVSMTLGGAYVTTNKSLRADRGAQERSNALKLVETQLESLKTLDGQNSTLITNPAFNPFCVTPTLTIANAAIGNVCHFSANGTNNNTAEPNFNISISVTGGGPIFTYTINATWNGIESNSMDSLQMSYRLGK